MTFENQFLIHFIFYNTEKLIFALTDCILPCTNLKSNKCKIEKQIVFIKVHIESLFSSDLGI